MIVLNFLSFVASLALVIIMMISLVHCADHDSSWGFALSCLAAILWARSMLTMWDRGHKVNDPLPEHWSRP